MRGALLFGAIALIALVLQTAVLPIHGAPDLLLIMCVYLGLRQHSVGGAAGAFFLGYLQDTFSGTTVGLNAFSMCLVFMTVYLTSRRLWVDNAISKVVVVFLAAVLKAMAILLLVAVFPGGEGGWRNLVESLLFQAVFAALLSPPVFAILAQTQLLATTEDG